MFTQGEFQGTLKSMKLPPTTPPPDLDDGTSETII